MSGNSSTDQTSGSAKTTDLNAVTEHLAPGDKEVVMQALGYKVGWKPNLSKSELCNRCSKKVYPVEKVDVGVLYHRGCFKCRVCNLNLTMQTFHREVDPSLPSNTKEVYCKKHVPANSKGLMDAGAVGIRFAMDAQKKASGTKRAGNNQAPLTAEGWEYDAQAIEFQRAKEKKQVDKENQRKLRKRASLRRKSSLRNWKELMVNGVFEAQNRLEEVHRKEEDELYQQIYEDRQKHIDQLVRLMETEKTQKIKKLIEYFESKGMSQSTRDATLKKVERFFKSLTEQRMDLLTKRIAIEEKAAVARMIERQSEEMLALIAQKETEIEEKMKTDEYNNYGMLKEDAIQLPNTAENDEEDREDKEEDNANVGNTEESQTESDSDNSDHLPEALLKQREDSENEDVKDIVQGSKSKESDEKSAETPGGEASDFTVSSDSESEDVKDDLSRADKAIVEISDKNVPTSEDILDELVSDHYSDKMPSSTAEIDSHAKSFNDGATVKQPLPSSKSFSDNTSTENITNDKASQPVSPLPVLSERLADLVISPAKEVQYIIVEKLHSAPLQINERVQADNTTVFQSVLHAGDKPTSGNEHLHSKKPAAMRELLPKSVTEEFYLKPDSSYKTSSKSSPQLPRKDFSVSSENTTQQTNDSLPQLPGSPRSRKKALPDAQQTTTPQSSRQTQTETIFESAKNKPKPLVNLENSLSSGAGTPHTTKATSSSSSATPVKSSSPGKDVKTPQKFDRSITPSSHMYSPGSGTEISISVQKTPSKTSRTSTSPHNKSKTKQATPQANTGGKKAVSLSVSKAPVQESEESSSDDDEDDDERSVSQAPKIKPAKKSKAKIVKDANVFKDLDTRAIAETRKELTTFTDLVRRLSVKCNTELEKVRAIFRWITAKDLNHIEFSEDVDPNTPMGLLRGIKYGTESYHDLFKRLCSYAGLHCEIIDGYSKGLGYRPGMTFKGSKFRNQWTAANVDGSWRFINCNWGARHVKSSDDQLPTYAVDEFYFLTDADVHIYQHFPDNPDWQLLKTPLSMEDFLRLPVVKSPFFNHGLSFVTKPADCVLQTTSGRIQLRLSAPKLYKYNTSLQSANNSVNSELIQDRCYTRTVNNDLVVTSILPQIGYYYLDVYVSQRWSDTVTLHACSFLIRCTEVYSGIATLSFPQEENVFGATPAMRQFGITPSSHVDSYISCLGDLQVKFNLNSDVRLGHTLLRWSANDKRYIDYSKYASLTHKRDSEATFSARFPLQSLYVLRLSTGIPEGRSHDDLNCFFRYLIHCKGSHENASIYPKASKKLSCMTLIEPLEGDLAANTNVQFQVESPMAISIAVVMGSQWSYLQKNANASWQGVVKISSGETKATMCVKFQEKFLPMVEYRISDAHNSSKKSSKERANKQAK